MLTCMYLGGALWLFTGDSAINLNQVDNINFAGDMKMETEKREGQYYQLDLRIPAKDDPKSLYRLMEECDRSATQALMNGAEKHD